MSTTNKHTLGQSKNTRVAVTSAMRFAVRFFSSHIVKLVAILAVGITWQVVSVSIFAIRSGSGGGEKSGINFYHPDIEKKHQTSVTIQESHVTGMNRYPDQYSAVKRILNGQESARILSFGSSTGEEAVTLATIYFNGPMYHNATIDGVDIDELSLETARQKVKGLRPSPKLKIEFFNGQREPIDTRAPYNVIFANSVLCFHGPFPLDKIVSHFSFYDFETTLKTLDASLKEGGLLAIVNMNYNLEDTEVGKWYLPLAKCQGNFVPRINRTTNALVQMNKDEWSNCVWLKVPLRSDRHQ